MSLRTDLGNLGAILLSVDLAENRSDLDLVTLYTLYTHSALVARYVLVIGRHG